MTNKKEELEKRILQLETEKADIRSKIGSWRHQMVKEGKKPFYITKVQGLEDAIKDRNITIQHLQQELKKIKVDERESNAASKRQQLFASIVRQLVIKEIGEDKAKEIFTMANKVMSENGL